MQSARPGLNEPLVERIGLCTPLGLNCAVTVANLEAGLVAFEESLAKDAKGEPVRAARVQALEEAASHDARVQGLLWTALADCLDQAPELPAELRVVLALGRETPSLMPSTYEHNGRACGLRLGPEDVIREGRAGLFWALERARHYLGTAQADRVLVGAIETQCDFKSLRSAGDASQALRAPSMEGRLPGEGAGFVLLSRSRDSEGAGLRLSACVVGREVRHYGQAEPNLARGLTNCMKALREQLGDGTARPDVLISSQTGERFFAQELTQALLRCPDVFPEPLAHVSVAEGLGDLGAAVGPVQLAWARYKITEAALPPPPIQRVLLVGSSDCGSVGACRLEVTP